MESNVDRRTFLAASVVGAALAPARGAFGAHVASLESDAPLRPSRLRPEYTLDDWVVYLNHGSIGTIPRAVQRAHEAYLRTCERNPWLHMWGGAWEEPREATRRQAASLMRCGGDEVALIHNTTEGFNQLAAGLPLGRGDEVLYGSLNHAGASVCWHHHAEARGYTVREFDFPQARVPGLTRDDVLQLYDDAIGPSTRVLVFPHIDNRVGLRHPMREVAALARARGVEFVAVDGAQSLGMIPVDLTASGVDFFASSPHKWIQAPKGLGVLYVRKGVQEALRPSWVSWGQQRWHGSARVFEDYGTRNLAATLALGDALDFQKALGEQAKEARYRELHAHALSRVESSAGLSWLSPRDFDMGGSLYSFSIEQRSARDEFDRVFAERGFVFRAFAEPAFDAARLSLNVFNSESEIDALVSALTR